MIDRDTQLCMSLTGRPGSLDTRFHNYLYEKLGLNFIYKAFTTQDIEAVVKGVRVFGIRGCVVSMPFEESCTSFLDVIDPSAKVIDSVNTIVNDNGTLTGFNTDYTVVKSLITSYQPDNHVRVMIRDSGGMSKAVTTAFCDTDSCDVIVAARNRESDPVLAKQYSFQQQLQPERITCGILVNVVPVGMTGGKENDELAYSEAMVAAASVVFDVVALPPETPVTKLARQLGKKTTSGAEATALQAVEQLVMYTSVRPNDALIVEAAEFARAGQRNRKRTPRMGALSVLGTMQQRTVAGQLSPPTASTRESVG